MKPSSSELLAAVADTIEKEVLPALDPADWTSSRLRSSLLILRHLERRVVLERDLVREDNDNMRRMLIEVSKTLQGKAPQIAMLADVESLPAADENPEALNESYNAMMDAVLRAMHDRRDLMDRKTFDDVRHRILSCLVRSQQRMSPLFEQLEGYSVL